MPGCPSISRPGTRKLDSATVWSASGNFVAGCARNDGRVAVDHWHFRDGRILGQQAAEGIGDSHRPRRAASGSAASSLGAGFPLLAFGSAAGLILGILATRVLSFHRVPGYAPRSAGVGRRRFWQCCCWACWQHGSRHDAPYRLILCGSYAKSNPLPWHQSPLYFSSRMVNFRPNNGIPRTFPTSSRIRLQYFV